MELQRERLRRNYQQELEAIEHTYRQQMGVGGEMPLPPFGPARAEPWRREMMENVEGIRQEIREIQEQREQEGTRWQDVRERLGAMKERLGVLVQRVEEIEVATAQAREKQQALAERQAQSARKQEELGTQVNQMAEQQKAFKQRSGEMAAQFRQEIDRLCTDLQRMGQTVGRIEQDRIKAEEGLKTQIGQLGNEVQALQTDQARTQNAVNWMLSQSDRSTVGSAGRSWGW